MLSITSNVALAIELFNDLLQKKNSLTMQGIVSLFGSQYFNNHGKTQSQCQMYYLYLILFVII